MKYLLFLEMLALKTDFLCYADDTHLYFPIKFGATDTSWIISC